MANPRAATAPNGPKGAEKTPFEQQREVLVGEIAIVRFSYQDLLSS